MALALDVGLSHLFKYISTTFRFPIRFFDKRVITCYINLYLFDRYFHMKLKFYNIKYNLERTNNYLCVDRILPYKFPDIYR